MEPDRPDFTEGTGLVPLGHPQIEVGMTRSASGDDRLWTFGEALLRVGLNDRIEARIGLNSYDRFEPGQGPNVDGFEDPYLGVKIRLAETEGARGLPPSAVSLLLLTTVPIGADGISAEVWQPTAKLALGWDLTPRFSLSSNLNYSYLAEGEERFHQIAASLSAGFALTDRLGSFVEAYGFSREGPGGDSTGYADTGLSYALSDDLALDARIGTGLQGPHPNNFAGVGISLRW
jgi:hypothetical protein